MLHRNTRDRAEQRDMGGTLRLAASAVNQIVAAQQKRRLQCSMRTR